MHIIGDRWTLVILFELLIGTSRFQELKAYSGSTAPLLSSRLKQLQAEGLIVRRASSADGGRVDYFLTPKGHDTLPVLLTLRAWGTTWCTADDDPHALRIVHAPCGTELSPDRFCRTCSTVVAPADSTAEFSARYAAERRRRLASSRTRT